MKIIQKICLLSLIFSLMVPYARAVEYGAEINPNETKYEQTFSDVPTDHWAFTYIAELTSRGAISGYPDGLFRPNRLVTREEFARIMVGAAGLTPAAVTQSSFADVPADYWASPFIEAARSYMTAYKNGSQYQFKPTAGALREDIAVAIVKLKGYDTRLADLSMLQAMFTDVDSISASAQPYVAIAVENSLISGYPNETFRAQDTISRAEAASILWRAFQYGSDIKVPGGEIPEPGTQTKPGTQTQPGNSEEIEKPGEQSPQSAYTMDTVADIKSELRSVVLTDDGTVYYIDGNTLYASNSDASIDLTQGLHYPLKEDNKNKSFALEDTALAYDSKKGIVYLLGNEQRRMVIYDVTDLSAPACLMARDLEGSAYTGAAILYNRPGNTAPDIFPLSNGALLVPIEEDRRNNVLAPCACMVFPEKGKVSPWGVLNTVVVGDKAVSVNGGTTMEIAKLSAPADTTTVSVEGEAPMTGNFCAGPEGIYFWEYDNGLAYIDLDGWRHTAVPVREIECVDLLPLPRLKVERLCVNQSGTCILFDNASQAIRILKKA